MSIKLASSTIADVRLGSSYVNSMFLESTLVYSNTISASGGTFGTFTSGSDTYAYHTFTGNGTFSVTQGSTNNARILVVGGGAGSPYGTFYNNGGGGGGVNYQENITITSGSYTVTVGTGGAANTNGNNSEFSASGLSIVGGGGGVSGVSGTPQSNNQGTPLTDRGAGGGGAGAVGGNSTAGGGGKGGDGLLNSINGTATYYGAGGGGGVNSYSNVYTPGAGGTNNGGIGGSRTANPGAGGTYGGAAGGTGYYPNSGGTTGGNGVVVVMYRQTTAAPNPPPAPGQTILPITASAGTLVLWSDTTSLTGSVLYDKSGNGNNALLSGSALAKTGSNGFMFNGTDNYLTWPTTLVGQPSSSYSVQYYGVPFSSAANYDFFVKEVYTNGWDMIYQPSFAKIVFRDTAGGDKSSATFTPSTTVKQQLVVTVDDASNVVTLYRNGALVGNFSGTSAVNAFNAVAVPFVFGYNANGDATYFKGSVASVALYNKVISAADVLYNYNALTASIF